MSRFFDMVTQPARDMGASDFSNVTPETQSGLKRLIKLDSNESPFGPSVGAIEAMKEVLSAGNLYPDDDCTLLRRKLAAHHGLPAEQVLVAAGSTGVLSLLCQTLLGTGLNAVTSERSFIVYSMVVQATGGHLIEARMHREGNIFDLDAILAAIDSNTRIVFLANPNNPTGTTLASALVERFVAQVPAHVIVILDEAYYEYAQHFAELRRVHYSNSLDYVRRGTRVVVLRTFSKAYGLAGLRVGYGLGPAELMGYCARMRNTYSVSSVAEAAALAALDDANYIQRVVENNAAQSRVLTDGLMALGYGVAPTSANFVFCDLGEDAATFSSRLQEEGVAVRPMGAWGAPNCVRVTIGTAEHNRAFLQAVKRVGARGPAEGSGVSSSAREN
jgi:histidinol-phosphate aminotransferase